MVTRNLVIAALCVFSFAIAMAFGHQQHLGPEEVEATQEDRKTDTQTDVKIDPLCIEACKLAKDCKDFCRHLPAINHLAFKNGVGIFFRNGLLLGLVREHGFLAGERNDPDPDLACLEEDIPQIQKIQRNNGWGDYNIEFSPMVDAQGNFNGGSQNFYDGRHPLGNPRKKMTYNEFIVTHTPSNFKLDGGIWAAFDKAGKYLWYPWFMGDSILKREYPLGLKYNKLGGGPKMLLGENDVRKMPATFTAFKALVDKPPGDSNPKGRIGELYPNFAGSRVPQKQRYAQFKWYGELIYAPANAREILKAGYGSDCLDHSIDKYHGNAEADVKEKDTDQSGAPKK